MNFEPTNSILLDKNFSSYSNSFSNIDADTANALATAGAQIISARGNSAKVQAKQQFRQQKKAAKLDRKSACGRKPMLPGKRKKVWEKCVAEYVKTKGSNVTPTPSSVSNNDSPTVDNYAASRVSNDSSYGSKKFISSPLGITLMVGAVLVVGFIGYKYMFGNKNIVAPTLPVASH